MYTCIVQCMFVNAGDTYHTTSTPYSVFQLTFTPFHDKVSSPKPGNTCITAWEANIWITGTGLFLLWNVKIKLRGTTMINNQDNEKQMVSVVQKISTATLQSSWHLTTHTVLRWILQCQDCETSCVTITFTTHITQHVSQPNLLGIILSSKFAVVKWNVLF